MPPSFSLLDSVDNSVGPGIKNGYLFLELLFFKRSHFSKFGLKGRKPYIDVQKLLRLMKLASLFQVSNPFLIVANFFQSRRPILNWFDSNISSIS